MNIRSLIVVFAVLLILGSAIIKLFFMSEDYSLEANVLDIKRKLERELTITEIQMQAVVDEIQQNPRVEFGDLNLPAKYPFYVYKRSRLFYWSDYRFVPDYTSISSNDSIRFVSLDHGKYIVRKWDVVTEADPFEIYAFITLSQDPGITNKYLSPSLNEDVFEFTDIAIGPLPQLGEEVHLNGKYLFTVRSDIQNTVYNKGLQYTAVASFLVGLTILLVLLAIWVNVLANTSRIELGFVVLGLSLIVIRGAMILLEFPNEYTNWLLFDSRLFASSDINASIGDLFLNTLLILALAWYLFRNYHRSSISTKLLSMSTPARLIFSVALVVAGFLALLYHYSIFKTIYSSAQWSVDITTNLQFPVTKIIFYLIFLINSVIFFLFYHVAFRIVTKLHDRSVYNLILSYSLGGLVFILISYLSGFPFVFVIIVNLAYFFILYFLKLPRFLIQLRYLAFLYLFISALVSATVGAYSIYVFEQQNKFNNKARFASQFLVENDNLAELLLSEAARSIKDDPLITSRIYSPFLSKATVAKKIRRVYLGSYFDKYDVQIYLYNAGGIPFQAESTIGTFDQIKGRFALDQYATDFSNLYFVNRIGADVTKRYLYFLDIERYDNTVGYIILDLSLKKVIPSSVYPELLVDSRYFRPYRDIEYSYAVFSGSEITYNSGSFNYYTDFDKDILENETLLETGIYSRGFQHLGVVDQDNRIIVISSPQYPIIDIISNFSFLFLILVVIILALIGVYSIYNGFSRINLKYATRIQLYLNFAFVLPLFVVSITTLSLINSSFKRELNNDYYDKAENLSKNIISDLDDYNKLNIDGEELSNNLAAIAQNANTDVNLFNIRGKLIATSQPAIYEKGILSEYINPQVFVNIKDNGNSRIILKESVGSLRYNSTYVGVKSFDHGLLIGILSIPFFDSEYILERQQIEVLSNIMNIFTFIFLIFLIISYLASKRLTLPLQVITHKIRKTSLSEYNEPLVWKSDDEIGMMVGEYNRMLVNLEKSKKALAQSEKETAWREMAQQVAHEIKNPLTPMKLTLQHLERSLKGSNGDYHSVEKPINTLLYQIETLSDIATSFSAFAKMPIPANERFELTTLVKNTFELHSNQDNASVTLQNYKRPIYVMGDEQLMGRILSNIIINSLQSAQAGQSALVAIKIKVTDSERVLISVSDNGQGIPDEIRDKVFVPNFSTKKSGSGIGLAIAKHGVEHAGGRIWFENGTKKGTTFFIELPIAD